MSFTRIFNRNTVEHFTCISSISRCKVIWAQKQSGFSAHPVYWAWPIHYWYH